MELYDIHSDIDRKLQERADRLHIPLGGTMELTPLCNMNCKMCYVHLTREEMEKRGRMLTCEEWLSIAREAKEEGFLFLLLTGGEPLLYPGFRKLYTSLTDMGFVVSLNTNGTLIDESWAELFAERPCRRINITLYGKDSAAYGALCGRPQGFEEVMRAARLLKERNVPFRITCSVTPENIEDLETMEAAVKELDVPFQPAFYMFPGMRRAWTEPDTTRLSPERAAQAFLAHERRQRTAQEFNIFIRINLSKLLAPGIDHASLDGFTCHAGRSGLWMNWKGEMTPCGMLNGPALSIREHGFRNCWERITESCRQVTYPARCMTCGLRNLCIVCPASAMAESGSYDGEQNYICLYMRELVRLMTAELRQEERSFFEKLLVEEQSGNPISNGNIHSRCDL